MRAARWDVVIDAEDEFVRILRRSGVNGPLLIGAPTTWEWFVIGTPANIVEQFAAEVAADGLSAVLRVPVADTSRPAGRFEHRLRVTDPAVTGPLTMARGFVTIRTTLTVP